MDTQFEWATRPSRLSATLGALAVAWVAAACGSSEGPQAPAWVPGSEATLPTRDFSGASALESAERIARIEHRNPGSSGAERAGLWIRAQLDAMGAAAPRDAGAGSEVDDATARDEGTASASTRVGVLPGERSDVLVLVARYAPAAVQPEASEAALLDAVSGAGVLLELGRALAARPRAYTIWLVFLGADRPLDAALLDDRARLVVVFESLAHPDLKVIRDLHSHRVHREAFWEGARALGLEAVFVRDAPFGSPESEHNALLDSGYRRTVALVGESGLPVGSMGTDARAEATGARLDEMGAVVLDTVDRISDQLSRIDGFSVAPLTSERWESPGGASERDPATPGDAPPADEKREAPPAASP